MIESVHGAVIRGGRSRRPKFEEITRPWAGPLIGSSFVEGGCYLYYFTFGKHRVLHQSTGGFIEENLSGLRPDIALLYPMNRNDSAEILKALQPKWYSSITSMSGGRQSRKACRNEIVNGLNGSPTTFERSILKLKPSSPSSSRPLPWSEVESEFLGAEERRLFTAYLSGASGKFL